MIWFPLKYSFEAESIKIIAKYQEQSGTGIQRTTKSNMVKTEWSMRLSEALSSYSTERVKGADVSARLEGPEWMNECMDVCVCVYISVRSAFLGLVVMLGELMRNHTATSEMLLLVNSSSFPHISLRTDFKKAIWKNSRNLLCFNYCKAVNELG